MTLGGWEPDMSEFRLDTVGPIGEAGGSLTLVISASRILRIFQITGLTKVLDVQRSVADAITADSHWQHAAESEAGSVDEWCRQHGLS
jgi:anti-sigma B factor antagonist